MRLWWSRQESGRARPSKSTGARSASAQTTAVRNSDLARDGFPFPEQVPAPAYEPQRDHALYLLHNALPYHSGGYATRTHGLLTELNRNG